MENNLESVQQAVITAIEHYYSLLAKKGSTSNTVVNELLVLSFIADILNDFPPLDEKDYNNLYKLWDCLASSNCLIPWADYKKYSGKRITGKTSMRVRISDNSLRVTNSNIRVTQL